MDFSHEEALHLSYGMAVQSLYTHQDMYLACVSAMRNSKGACEKLFRKRLREINWRDFENALARRLG